MSPNHRRYCAGIASLGRGLAWGAATTAALGGAALLWGSIERRLPTIRRYEIEMPAYRGIHDVTLLHISDLHMYPGQEFLLDFLAEVAATQHFDAVISTGDNLGASEGIDLAIAAHELFADRPGAFVFGSNDYFSPRRKRWSRYLRTDARDHDDHRETDLPWAELANSLRQARWLDLSNQSLTMDIPTSVGTQTLALLGVDDPHIDRDRLVKPVSQWFDDHVLRLGVTHAPYLRVVNAMSDAGADLILAGHTHGGQIGLPGYGALVTNCDLPRAWAKGVHEWVTPASQTLLHVSAGLGTSPYAPVRIATRPEVSLLHFISV